MTNKTNSIRMSRQLRRGALSKDPRSVGHTTEKAWRAKQRCQISGKKAHWFAARKKRDELLRPLACTDR